MSEENLNHFTAEYRHNIFKRCTDMRIKYFGKNRENGTKRVAVIRFTDNEKDMYEFIANYENTYENENRAFFNGRVFEVGRDENGVTINEAYIDVDDFSDFNDFKANYKEAKKEFKLLKKQTSETKQEATDFETSETKESTDTEVGEFVYDVVIHNFYGIETYTVRADGWESAKDKALKIMKNESLEDDYYSIDSIRIYEENSDELLKEIIFEPSEAKDTTEKKLEKLEKKLIEPVDTHFEDIKKFKEKTELNTNCGVLADDQFHRLTKTLIKSLFKAIGIEETRKIPFIISNNMVFFNYNGIQYKYYPSQCKVFKKCGRKYQRINWKNFADDNSPNDQNQALGRSPPLLLI